jgi:hypothetical protein
MSYDAALAIPTANGMSVYLKNYIVRHSRRAETNPADNWYKRVMGFFDFYIIHPKEALANAFGARATNT